MKTIKELGQLIKKKYPGQYSDLTDEEVGRRIKKKYAPSYDDYQDAPDPRQQLVINQAKQLQEFFDPDSGRLRSWLKTWKLQGHQQTLSFITPSMVAVIEQGAMLEDAAVNSDKKYVEFLSWIVHNSFVLYELKQKAHLLEQATRQGLSVAGLETKRLAQNESRLRVRESQNASSLKIQEEAAATTQQLRVKLFDVQAQLDLEQALSHIRLSEFKEKETITLNNKITEMNERLRLALIAKTLTTHQKIILVQGLLDGIYEQIEEIHRSKFSPETKRRMVEDREAIVTFFKQFRDEQGRGLLGALK
jgi:hypothetical protein